MSLDSLIAKAKGTDSRSVDKSKQTKFTLENARRAGESQDYSQYYERHVPLRAFQIRPIDDIVQLAPEDCYGASHWDEWEFAQCGDNDFWISQCLTADDYIQVAPDDGPPDILSDWEISQLVHCDDDWDQGISADHWSQLGDFDDDCQVFEDEDEWWERQKAAPKRRRKKSHRIGRFAA